MKGVKQCYGLLLVLSIMVGLSLSVSSGSVNALRHDYDGIPLLRLQLPFGHYSTDSNGVKSIDWDYHYSFLDFDSATNFLLETDSEYRPFYDSVYSSIHPYVEDNECKTTNDFYGILLYNYSENFTRIYADDNADVYDPRTLFDNNTNYQCRYHEAFGVSPQLSFASEDNFSGLDRPANSQDTGIYLYHPKNSLTTFNKYFNNHWYSTDGLSFNSPYITSNGVHYINSFRFSYITHDNEPILSVSRLMIPLWSYDSYWTDPYNFTADREFEWRGAFQFDEPFQFGNFGSDSGADVHIIGRTQDGLGFDQVIPCRITNTTGGEEGSDRFYQLTYSCHGYLDESLIYALPYLDFYNESDYFFSTTGDWRFAHQFVVTDNDPTPGQTLGGFNNVTNFYNESDSASSSADWFSSLTNLFSFGFLNPFAPIFQLFTDNSNCVEIPTIANMLHAEETTVCPWFSPSVRTIVTPVLGLSSMMLIFGFAVRWLGAGSGNMFEDAGTIDAPSNRFIAGESGTIAPHGWRIRRK